MTPSANLRCVGRIAVSSACGLNSHVRKSTLLSIPQALSLHFIRILPSALTASFGDLLCQSPIPQCGHVRLSTLPFAEGAFSRISSKWRRQANGQFVRASSSPIFLFRGRNTENSERDVLRHDAHLFGAYLSTTNTLSKTVSRAAQPSVHRRCNRRLNAAAFRGPRRKYFRWGKAMRPRKPDGKLSRHGLGARRVALLAPRGVLN